MTVLGYSPQQPPAEAQSFNQPGVASATSAPGGEVPNSAPAPSSGPPMSGAQGGAALTATSQSTPLRVRPTLSPDAYHQLAQKNPQLKQYIDDAAQATGVSPIALAHLARNESSFQSNPATSSSGAIGTMQVEPGTAHMVDPSGRFDIHNPEDNVMLGALYYRKLTDMYGENSPSAFAAYFEGPQNLHAALAHPDTAQQDFPKMFSYLNNIYGKPISLDALNDTGHIQPDGFVKAAVQGGPDAAMQYMVHMGPQGMGTSDLWRQAQAKLVNAFMSKGDIEGAQHARDFVTQLSHAGSNMYLMHAYQSLAAGDGADAAQALARAHSFFPDGTVGQFRTNGTSVWADRYDEQDPSQRIGAPLQITPDAIAGLLNQTTDPKQFLATLTQQQQATAAVRYKAQMGNYYSELPQTREDVAQTHAGATVEAAQARAAGTVGAAEVRSAKGSSSQANAIDKEVNGLYGPGGSIAIGASGSGGSAAPSTAALGNMAETYKDLRTNGGLSGPQSYAVVDGLQKGTLKAVPQPDGRAAVVGQGGKPVAYLSPSTASTLGVPNLAAAGSPASPIGAASATPYARGAGISSNMTGTVMPNQGQPMMAPATDPQQQPTQ